MAPASRNGTSGPAFHSIPPVTAAGVILGAAVEADGDGWRAERFEVLGEESPPQVLTQRHGEHGEGDRAGVALHAQIVHQSSRLPEDAISPRHDPLRLIICFRSRLYHVTAASVRGSALFNGADGALRPERQSGGPPSSRPNEPRLGKGRMKRLMDA